MATYRVEFVHQLIDGRDLYLLSLLEVEADTRHSVYPMPTDANNARDKMLAKIKMRFKPGDTVEIDSVAYDDLDAIEQALSDYCDTLPG